MSRNFALLVNPASAGGRALEALPTVHATLDGLGARHRTVTTRSIDHAHQEALNAAWNGAGPQIAKWQKTYRTHYKTGPLKTA